jgi:hypothetical protein
MYDGLSSQQIEGQRHERQRRHHPAADREPAITSTMCNELKEAQVA